MYKVEFETGGGGVLERKKQKGLEKYLKKVLFESSINGQRYRMHFQIFFTNFYLFTSLDTAQQQQLLSPQYRPTTRQQPQAPNLKI